MQNPVDDQEVYEEYEPYYENNQNVQPKKPALLPKPKAAGTVVKPKKEEVIPLKTAPQNLSESPDQQEIYENVPDACEDDRESYLEPVKGKHELIPEAEYGPAATLPTQTAPPPPCDYRDQEEYLIKKDSGDVTNTKESKLQKFSQPSNNTSNDLETGTPSIFLKRKRCWMMCFLFLIVAVVIVALLVWAVLMTVFYIKKDTPDVLQNKFILSGMDSPEQPYSVILTAQEKELQEKKHSLKLELALIQKQIQLKNDSAPVLLQRKFIVSENERTFLYNNEQLAEVANLSSISAYNGEVTAIAQFGTSDTFNVVADAMLGNSYTLFFNDIADYKVSYFVSFGDNNDILKFKYIDKSHDSLNQSLQKDDDPIKYVRKYQKLLLTKSKYENSVVYARSNFAILRKYHPPLNEESPLSNNFESMFEAVLPDTNTGREYFIPQLLDKQEHNYNTKLVVRTLEPKTLVKIINKKNTEANTTRHDAESVHLLSQPAGWSYVKCDKPCSVSALVHLKNGTSQTRESALPILSPNLFLNGRTYFHLSTDTEAWPEINVALVVRGQDKHMMKLDGEAVSHHQGHGADWVTAGNTGYVYAIIYRLKRGDHFFESEDDVNYMAYVYGRKLAISGQLGFSHSIGIGMET